MDHPKLTLDEALALMDKHEAADAAKAPSVTVKKVEKVKDIMKAGAKAGRSGLGSHTRDLLAQIDY